jgi:hypothetical protein
MEGRNIVFINIALNETEGAWHYLVAANKLPNVQLRLAGGPGPDLRPAGGAHIHTD